MMGLAGFFLHTIHCTSSKQFVVEVPDSENLEENTAKVGKKPESRALRALLPVVINTWPFINATAKGILLFQAKE